MASAQDGKTASVRIWDVGNGSCLTMLCAHASGMVCVDVSGDGRALLAVGLDSHGRQQIVLWDISEVKKTRRARVLVKSTTDYNVKRAKISPYEANKFVTVGRDSIRLYRIKNGVLKGLSIQVINRRADLFGQAWDLWKTWAFTGIQETGMCDKSCANVLF
jgi:WD repeat-containing protein 90